MGISVRVRTDGEVLELVGDIRLGLAGLDEQVLEVLDELLLRL